MQRVFMAALIALLGLVCAWDASACEGDESAHLCTMSCIQALEDAPPVATVQVCARDADAAKVPAQSALLLEQNCAALAFDGSGDSTLHTLECAGCEGDTCTSQGGLLGSYNLERCRFGEIPWWETLYCLLTDGEQFPLPFEEGIGPGFNDPTDPLNIRWYCEGSTWAGTPLPQLPDVYAPVNNGQVSGEDKDWYARNEALEHWSALGWSHLQINWYMVACYDYEDTIP